MIASTTLITGRVPTGQARSLPPRPAAPRCRTTRCGNCRQSQRLRLCPPPSPARVSCDPGTRACRPPPSWLSTPPLGGARQSLPKIIKEATTIGFSFSESLTRCTREQSNERFVRT